MGTRYNSPSCSAALGIWFLGMMEAQHPSAVSFAVSFATMRLQSEMTVPSDVVGLTMLAGGAMPKVKLIVQKHARGNYEIGIRTEDGVIVAQVRIWDGTAIDSRSESEREAAAFEKAARLAHAFISGLGL